MATTTKTAKTASNSTISIARRIEAAGVAIDAWEAASLEEDRRAGFASRALQNAAYTARCVAFDKAIETIEAAAKAGGFKGRGGAVNHRGKLYAVVSADRIPGMVADSVGRLTIVQIEPESIVEG